MLSFHTALERNPKPQTLNLKSPKALNPTAKP